MKKTVVVLLAAVGLFCSAGTARIDLISGNAGLRAISTAPGVSGKNMNWLPPEKARDVAAIRTTASRHSTSSNATTATNGQP